MSVASYPKKIDENLKFRAKVVQKAETNKKFRQTVITTCKLHPLFFFDVLCWTENPRLDDSNLPFITYPFQAKYILDIIECINVGRDSCTEKSRDMGFSWMMVVIHVWGFLFKGWSSLYGSYKENYVDKQGDMDAFFERVRYVLYKLPPWLRPADLRDKFMTISSKELRCSITGDSGENFGTAGRQKFVTLDEFALWSNAGKAFRKTKDVTNCRIFGGTPEGRHNIYGKIMTHHDDFSHLDIKRFTLHWRLHPLKTEEWYLDEKKKRLKIDVAKELDISYDDSVTGAVYKEFARTAVFGKVEFNPKLRLYTCWDFGRDMTAIIWFQKDFETDKLYIIDAYQKNDKDMDFFVPFITGNVEITPESRADGEAPEGVYDEDELDRIELHKGWTNHYANHFGDPYNIDNRSAVSANTIRKQLTKHGINVLTKRTKAQKGASSVYERIQTTALAMRRMNVNEHLHDFIQAIIQSRYPQVKENSEQTSEHTKPVHSIDSHFRTALEYGMDNEPAGFVGRKSTGGAEHARAYADRVLNGN